MRLSLFRHLFLAAAVTCLSSSLSHAQSGGDTIKATATIHPDGSQTTTVMDPEKRTAEEVTKTSGGKILRKTTYLLDDRNQPLGAIAYDAKGTVLYRSSYKRDGLGRIDEETVTSDDGKPLRRRVYTYGNANKVSRVDEYDASGNLIIPPRKQSPARPDKKR